MPELSNDPALPELPRTHLRLRAAQVLLALCGLWRAEEAMKRLLWLAAPIMIAFFVLATVAYCAWCVTAKWWRELRHE